MSVLLSGYEWGVGIALLAGSPAIGYIVLRSVSASSKYWQGWKRMAGAALIGGGWWATHAYVFAPLTQSPVSVSTLMQYAAFSGGGLIVFTGVAALTNRLVIARALQSFMVTHSSNAGESNANAYESPVPYGRAYGELSYKPSQMRAPASKSSVVLEEPTIEKGEDVLSLLKEENFDAKKNMKPFQSGEWKAGEENERATGRRAPLRDLGEFEGFDETLAQLQRDLKDFNENVAGPRTKKARN